MSVAACAALVEKGDPDRFLATMAAPVKARAVLFPIYAFNLEVARAPWLTEEPMIAEMRLQWWRDALDEIAEKRPVRRHEVATPLADILDPVGAGLLDSLVNARRADIEKIPHADDAALDAYLDATAGTLAWAAARALGADPRAERPLRAHAWAGGLARYFRAIPELEARGHAPLPDGRPEAVRALAREGLRRYRGGLFLREVLGRLKSASMLDGWLAGVHLTRAARAPIRVAAGQLDVSPARARITLAIAASARRWGAVSGTLDRPPPL
ncbi:MAG: squalene/phytoene synthase family protein [Pseudomonadota bacterium]